MTREKMHELLVDESHDEHSRMSFVASLKHHLTNNVSGGNKFVFEATVKPGFAKANKREPDRHEIRKMMSGVPFYQMASSLKRTAQELMWESAGSCVERQIGSLIETYRTKASSNQKLGSIMLDTTLEVPRYNSAIDIHCMPGGYHTDRTEDDVFAGAMQERAGTVFMMRDKVEDGPSFGTILVNFLAERFPDFKPRRVLDFGCTFGSSTLAYCDAWPEAEVHAIDLGAPVLRYGHGRAESMGRAVHFSQQNMEHTRFEDASFDLVTSNIVLHEVSRKALDNIMKECRRLLRKGGIMLHGEGPQYHGVAPFEQSVLDWDTHYNAEPFIGSLHDLDLFDVMADADFKREEMFEAEPIRPQITGNETKYRANDYNLSGSFLVFGAVRS